MASKRWLSVALLVGLCGMWSGAGSLQADEPEAAQESALEVGLSALRLRMQAKLKEADLLEKSGHLDEALAATREVERIYREGMAELKRLLADAPPAPSKPQAGVPAPEETPEVAEEEIVEKPESDPSLGVGGGGGGAGGAFRGRGGSKRSPADDAVVHGLSWLAAHQAPDGSWQSAGFGKWCDLKENPGERPDGPGKAVYDVGVTGLALAAFLGAGYTHRGDHEFAKTVRRGLNYLKSMQDAEGCFGPRQTQHYIYNHVIATLAMVEAYGMTEAVIFKGSAQKGLDFIALSRNPYFVWRYGVKPGDNDTSVTVWACMALKSAQLINQDAVKHGRAAPLTTDEEAFDGVKAWVDKMTDRDYGRVGYVARGSGPARPQELVDRFPGEKSESMTAAAVLMRVFLGGDPRKDDMIKKGADLMSRLPPTWNTTDGSIDMYYWYYGTLAMFQVGGEHWRRWDAALLKAIPPNQRMDGTYCGFKGSWDPVDPWSPDGGRVYSTALMLLCSEVLYRYDRVFVGR